MGTKETILEGLKEERAAFERVLVGLNEAQLITPGVTPEGWSVKDLLAHITAWEAELVTAMFRMGQGGRQAVPSLAQALEHVDAWNAERHAENATRPLERILADWRGVRQALIARVGLWDERQLTAPVAWHPQITMDVLIASNSYAHEGQHREALEAWKAQGAPLPGGAA